MYTRSTTPRRHGGLNCFANITEPYANAYTCFSTTIRAYERTRMYTLWRCEMVDCGLVGCLAAAARLSGLQHRLSLFCHPPRTWMLRLVRVSSLIPTTVWALSLSRAQNYAPAPTCAETAASLIGGFHSFTLSAHIWFSRRQKNLSGVLLMCCHGDALTDHSSEAKKLCCYKVMENAFGGKGFFTQQGK